MFLPSEIVQNIYLYLDIDTKIIFNKLYGREYFKIGKVIISNKKNIEDIYLNKVFKTQLRHALLHRFSML